MKRTIFVSRFAVSVVVFFAIVALLITASFAQTKSNAINNQSEIERLTQDWHTAFAKGDGAAMDQMEASNLIVINAGGTGDIWHKDGPRAGKLKAIPVIFTLGKSEVRQFGNTAILTGSIKLKITDTNKTDEMSETVVWIRQNNKWVISSAQWSSVIPNKSH